MKSKKAMTIVIVLAVVIVAMAYVGCKVFCPQPLDKGMEWGEESASGRKTVNEIDEEDGHNKEAILDGPNGTSTHAFTGSGDTTELEMLDGPGYEYEPTEHDLKMRQMIVERKKQEKK